MEEIAKMLNQIQKDMTSKEQLSEMEKNITEKINANTNEKFNLLEHKHKELEKKVEELETRTDAFEREIRKRNLVFFGVEESEKNYYDLQELVLHIVKDNLKIQCGYQDIACVRRLGKKSEQKIRPVIITLHSMGMKIEIMKKKKMLESSQWYIKEDYPPKILEKRKELQDEIKRLRDQGIHAVIKYDRIIILENEKEIDKYKIKNSKKRRLSETPEEKKKESKKNENTTNYKQLQKKNKSNNITSYLNNSRNNHQNKIDRTQTPNTSNQNENLETSPKN